MNSGFWSAVSGAKTHQNALDTTANNIANINTNGYRASMFEFSSLFSRYLAVNSATLSSDDGVGVRTGATSIDLKYGAYQQTDNLFDIAITDDGWFGVVGKNPYDARDVAYTRSGAFSRDESGRLVTQSGNYVLGSSWGNLVNENGAWKILPDAGAGSSAVGTQTPISIPESIYFPPIATKTASMNANLPNAIASTSAANAKTPLGAIFDENRNLLASGGKLLLGAGDTANMHAANGAIYKTINIAAISSSSAPLDFTLNGEAISVSWAAGATNADITIAIQDAINLSGAATAVADGEKITIASDTALSIADSNNSAITNLNAQIVSIEGNLGDLAQKINAIVLNIYPQANVYIDHEGKIAVENGGESFNLLSAEGGGAGAGFLSAFASFDGGSIRKLSSASFQEAARSASQKAISPSGEILTLESQTRLISPANAASGAEYAAIASLKKEEVLNSATVLSSILTGQKEAGLAAGEDLWFSFGKSPTATNAGLGYSLPLSGDITDGVNPALTLTIDGITYNYVGADGDGAAVTIAGVAAVLNAAGYKTDQSGSNLIIYPKGESLVLTGGSSNLPGAVFTPMSLGRVVFSEGETAGQFVGAINQIANAIGVTAAIENGAITYAKSGSDLVSTGVYAGRNTSQTFLELFSELNQALVTTASTSKFSAMKTLSSAESIVRLDTNGEVIEGKSVSLDNGGGAIAFDFNLAANNALSESAAIKADGIAEGKLEQYAIDKNGHIIAVFDNAQQRTIAQVAVYHFANDQGLMRIDGTMFMQSANSGAPFFYVDDNGNLISAVVSHTLETSNTQAAVALSELILYQRSYEGSAKAITTNDQLIQNAINMKK